MDGLAGPVGINAADRLGGGPADSTGVFAEVDGDGLGGDLSWAMRAPGLVDPLADLPDSRFGKRKCSGG